MKGTNKHSGIAFAVLAAALYALSTPCSKLLLGHIPSTMLAALLYIGAGVGMSALYSVQKLVGVKSNEPRLAKADLPYIIGMVALDIAAPIFLMLGLSMTPAENVSLLNNFEIVATSVIALVIFKETISRRLWIAIALVTVASVLLSVDDISAFSFSYGSLLVLLACVCWGFENNCTRRLSEKNPLEIVIIKGIFSGLGAFAIALLKGEKTDSALFVLLACLLGFVAYGLSIFLYIYAQRTLGAAKTSTYYAIAPFIGAALSLMIFRELPSALYFIALATMLAGAYFAATDGA